ncbi:MAG: TonB family protein [Acidobacteria bacterium]|jgi:TonB family protein|nr:TonB family protein [Acidobacteriota bacterium]
MKEYKVMNEYVYYRDLFSDTMGINYRVAPVQNRRPTGHKVLCEVSPSIAGNADMWKRVKLLLEGIRKSNIPFLYSPEKINVGEKGSQLVFDYFKGKNFEQILVDAEKKGMPINFDLAMSISIAIADIIEVGSSIIVSGERSYHGFLTPDNILVHYDGKIFLKNYGIFQYLEKNDAFYSETEKRYGAWLTPEFIRKERIVAQSDIYHLGYLIYRILTGKYFSYSSGEDFDAKFANLTFKQYMPSTDKNFLTNVITFFKKTLNPDPLKRFLTIKEFKDFVATYFHIEELSSITFNLAYFMNSLYGEAVEEEEKVLKHELAYMVPEPKKEAPTTQQGKEDLVSGILEGLDERKKAPGWLWPVLGVVALALALGGFLAWNSSKTAREAKQQAIEAASRVEQENLRRAKEMEAQTAQLKAMTDELLKMKAEQATIADEKKRAEAEQKIRKFEDEKRIKEQELAQKKSEEEARLLEESKRQQQQEEELGRIKAEEEQKKLEEEKKRAEAAKTKTGDQVPINEVTIQPAKLSGSAPAISSSMKTKYKGKTMTIMTTIMVDENGNVAKIKILTGNVPSDIKALIEETLQNWKYSPAQKDNVKVKVWLSVPFKFAF